jgi:microsomal epoxide hydrolase
MKYSPPSSAKPFTLRLPNEDILDWRQLLQLSKLGPATYENTQDKVNYGVSRTWLSNARDYWLDQYDWRAQEEHINSFDNYTMQIECIDLHFIAIFSEKEDAIPIVLIHGWPGSFVEFLPMLDLIRGQYSKRDMPYHIIIPSLPGYTLSKGLPTDVHWTMEDSARILNTLMMNLGFQEYLAQGGDVGSFEARRMAQDYDACVGVHGKCNRFDAWLHLSNAILSVNLYITQPSLEDSQLEDTALVKAEEWLNQSSSYAQEQATRPSTIGHVLSSSPLALLAW